MSKFWDQLKSLNSSPEGRRWIFVPYDQLSAEIGPLADEAPEKLGIVLVENLWKPKQRPYHKQKIGYILGNMRHFALEQAGRGVAVRYVFGDAPYSELLAPVIEELGPLEMMEAAERELRKDLEGLEGLTILPHQGWLTREEHFENSQNKLKTWRMDSFYRHVRQETEILMENGKPIGGRYSLDGDNRKPWKGEPELPEPPTFPDDPIKSEVGELIKKLFSHHPGKLDLSRLPTTYQDAQDLWGWAKQQCMEHFGTYEDAMTVVSSGLFHTRLSPLMNLHRILPKQVLDEVLELDIPLNSKEGFVRQLIGWREFMRHVHRETDGFRNLPDAKTETDGGATPNFLEGQVDLPAAFWEETKSGLFCLDQVVEEVWNEGYSHHITRLMVLSNLGTLWGVKPRQLTDWFWVAYIDAFDWVVEPNVLGMGMFALGELFTTKPYVSGSAYIDKMSDYCKECQFHPKKTCPITHYYWAFVDRNAERLKDNQRMRMMLRNVAKRSEEKKERDQWVLKTSLEALGKGQELSPKLLED